MLLVLPTLSRKSTIRIPPLSDMYFTDVPALYKVLVDDLWILTLQWTEGYCLA